MIYFVLNEAQSAIKIGYSSSMSGVTKRIAYGRVWQVDRLTLLAVHDGTMADEKRLHRRFRSLRRRGEWFSDDPRIREHIASEHDFYAEIRRAREVKRVTRKAHKHAKHEAWLADQERAKLEAGELVKDETTGQITTASRVEDESEVEPVTKKRLDAEAEARKVEKQLLEYQCVFQELQNMGIVPPVVDRPSP